MAKPDKLLAVVKHLGEWREAHKGDTKGRCLEAVRHALGKEGLVLPWNPYPQNTALWCLHDLKANAGKWHWSPIHRDDPRDPLPAPCLVFFRGCGKLKDGRVAGHVAVLGIDGKHYSNSTFTFNDWWKKRLAGAFLIVPPED